MTKPSPQATIPKPPSPYQLEVDRNFEAFQKLPTDYCHRHNGMHALMKDQKVIQLFSSWQDARKAAKLLYRNEPFSIQEVGAEPIDLGFWSYAVL